MSPPHNSFSTDEYWEEWYSYNTNVYDWLMGPDFFDEHILHGNKAKFDANTIQQVLNIGSGTSMLPFHLDRVLDHDIQIHNIDFAYEAVEWGKAKTPEENIARGPSKMSFEQGSLLDLPTLLRLYTPRRIDLILDKGTSDAIACGHHLTYTYSPAVSLLSQKKVSPLIIMALNLAVIAATGSRWLCLSLFARRFPFMSWRYHHAVDRLGRGFPRPSTYWRVVKCRRIERDSEVSEEHEAERQCGLHCNDLVFHVHSRTKRCGTPCKCNHGLGIGTGKAVKPVRVLRCSDGIGREEVLVGPTYSIADRRLISSLACSVTMDKQDCRSYAVQ